nr:N-terminal Rep/C1 [Grapevine geminivirus A defective DNA]
MAATSSGRGIYFTPFTPLDGLIELTPIANMPRKPSSFRLNAKNIFLTYPQCHISKESALEQLKAFHYPIHPVERECPCGAIKTKIISIRGRFKDGISSFEVYSTDVKFNLY